MFRLFGRRFGLMMVACAVVISLTAGAALIAALIVYLLSLLVP